MSEWIVTRAEVLGGKPCIRGTRISVEHVLELFASGASMADVLSAHPHLTVEGVRAALDYAAASLRNESLFSLKIPA